MTRNLPLGPLAGCVYFALIGPLLAAQPAKTEAPNPTATESDMAAPKAAGVCWNDLKSFNSKMEKDGYWVSGEGYGFGYPMGAAGLGLYGGSGIQNRPAIAGRGYYNARPGYEVRVLVASANILARQGQQEPCESVLTVARGLYKHYLSDMQHEGGPVADMPGWRQRQIAAAAPVMGSNVAFRSDELIGVEVRSPKGAALGSVDDLVLSPDTGKLAYVVIARGGIFGFDETRIPIPWDDFKAAPNASLLVLGTTNTVLDAAPKVEKSSFSISGAVGSESQKVDAYWKANQAVKAAN
jgi:sporulation protein YlmC with PRC-barrel domain